MAAVLSHHKIFHSTSWIPGL